MRRRIFVRKARLNPNPLTNGVKVILDRLQTSSTVNEDTAV
ncbi:hypothetical protein [Salinibacter ruber]|nr:hypothetical protein [Salinibacter ruber]MCS3821583.1 hypothetical protein [Salinibacter ruber]